MHRTKWPVRLALVAMGLFTFATPWVLSGCNTTKGVGQDIEAAGDAIEDAADGD